MVIFASFVLVVVLPSLFLSSSSVRIAAVTRANKTERERERRLSKIESTD